MSRRIGILGGSLDPVHIGHLILAQEAVAACRLDSLVWVPSGAPPHKSGPRASCDDRIAMVERAIQGHPVFSVSRAEVDRVGKSYTVQTLEDIGAEREAGACLWLLIGADNAIDFDRWYAPERVVELAEIVVLSRPGVARDSAYGRFQDRMHFLDTPLIEISSTAIRDRILEGKPTRYWVPDAVRDYIEERRLYTTVEEK